MRDRGLICEVTEHYNAFTKRRNDLMGFCDILCLGQDTNDATVVNTDFGRLAFLSKGNNKAIAVQTTSGSNTSARVKKIMAEPRAELWLRAGNMIEVHGWRKAGPRGKRKTWQCRIEKITLEDLTKTNQGL